MEVQNRVINLEALCPRDGRGMYGQETPGRATFCNHAVFLAIQALDGNFHQFIGHPELHSRVTSPYNVAHLVRDTAFWREHRDFESRHRRSNLWCVILREQAANSDRTGIHRIGPEEAQEMANRGYVVIGSWMNMTRHGSPHFATVRPHFEAYNPNRGPLVANVGESNGIYFTRRDGELRGAFRRDEFDAIEWYYNRNQQFRKDFSIRINGLK
jgi:hypothetical protein